MARGEALLWLEQARRDLEAARALHGAGHWYAAVFWCRQAAGKALKAVLLAAGKAARGHNLIELARLAAAEVGEPIPDSVDRCVRSLNPHYVVARYPDAANGLPSEVYTREDSERALRCAGEVVSWAEGVVRR